MVVVEVDIGSIIEVSLFNKCVSMSKIKKVFPKIKKSLQNFLTDESGEITKKNALWLAFWAAILSWIDDALAATQSFHYSWAPAHINSGHSSWWSRDHSNSHVNWYENGYFSNLTVSYNDSTFCTTNHASGVVNGHFSWRPTTTINSSSVEITGTQTHNSHSSCGAGHW